MGKPIPKIKTKASARKSKPKKQETFQIIGVDGPTLSSIAFASVAYNATLKLWKGPEFLIVRWNKDDHYFDRISELAKAHDFILDLQAKLKITCELRNVWIAQEEPWPMGRIKFQSQSMKQQAELSGAFLGGLLRYGYQNIFQIHNTAWRQIVARDLGITIGHKVWNNPELAGEFNCVPKKVGKFRSRQWALSHQGYGWQHFYPNEIPVWPDLIERKGLIPRPEDSRAKAVQPDDRYDALAIMTWMEEERSRLAA